MNSINRLSVKKNKIVFFLPGLNIGGIERVFVNYANIFAQKGEDITLLTCHENGVFESLLDPKVNFINLKTNDLKRSIFGISVFLHKTRPNYIFTANAATIVVCLAKLLCFSKVKVVASHHNYCNVENVGILNNYFLWRLYNLCYKIIGVSDGISKFLIKKGVNQNKIVCVNNPINITEIISKSIINVADIPICPYILFVGRLSIVKNITRLIKSFSQIQSNINLAIVGDGPEKENLMSLCKKIGVSNKVVFLGSKTNPFPYIANAKAVALSSDSEAYPTILLEALILGKTIASTPTDGAKEILKEGKLGYISTDFTDESFLEVLKKSIDQPLESNYLINKSHQYYSPDTIVFKIRQEIFNEVEQKNK